MYRRSAFRVAAAAAAASASSSTASGGGDKTAGPKLRDLPCGSSAQEYATLTLKELRALLEKRVTQIHEIRDIHEKTHLSAEKAYRKQLMDYDEKSIIIGMKSGKDDCVAS